MLLLWLSRLWLQASRGELHEDPVVYAITDKRSLLLGAVVVAIVLSACRDTLRDGNQVIAKVELCLKYS